MKNSTRRYTKVKQVAILGVIGNIVLLIGKLIVGLHTRSQAMIADGLNSAGDVFASVMTFLGNKISSVPKDKNHPYGHGKAEYVFSMIISFSLFGVALTIFKSSFDTLMQKQQFEYSNWLIYIALGTIVTKLILFIFANRIGKSFNSLLAVANAEDHRNDIFITLLTLISIILGLHNIYIVDGVAGIIISFWIAYTAIKIFIKAFMVLMDTNLDEGVIGGLEKYILGIAGVDHIDSINSKPTGINYILIVKVSVDANKTVYEGHKIAAQIKERLIDLEHIEDVIVHVNPA